MQKDLLECRNRCQGKGLIFLIKRSISVNLDGNQSLHDLEMKHNGILYFSILVIGILESQCTENKNSSEIRLETEIEDRKSTRLNSSHVKISYAVFCLKKKKNTTVYSEK